MTKDDVATHKKDETHMPELRERVEHLEARAEATTRQFVQLVDALTAKLGPLTAPKPEAPKPLAIVKNAKPCPKHPDAPQTVNGCTAPGCNYSAPQAPQEA